MQEGQIREFGEVGLSVGREIKTGDADSSRFLLDKKRQPLQRSKLFTEGENLFAAESLVFEGSSLRALKS